MPKNNKPVDVSIEGGLIRLQMTNIRKSLHMTQKSLSEKSGLSEGCISNIEDISSDNPSPTLKSVLRYLNAIGAELYIKIKD